MITPAMSRVRHLLLDACLIAAVVFSPAPMAASAGSGSYVTADAKASFKHVYAYRVVDEDDPAVRYTELVFGEQPLDTAAIAAGMQARGGDSTTSVLWEKVQGAFAKLRLHEDGNTELYVYVPPGYNFNYGGTSAELTANTPERVEGSFRLDDTDMDGKPRTVQLTFAAEVASMGSAPAGGAAAGADDEQESPVAEQAAGEPLPQDGGEPGMVFLEAMKAQREGDFDAMLSVSSQAQRERMLADRDKPEFPAMVEMMKNMAAESVDIGGGRVNGETATIDFTGHYSGGGSSKGTATLLREDGRWVVQQVSETIGGE
ncbi:MAG: hypothetical protein R3F45_13840 [Gammaproteobacteria bacterium]